MPWNYNRLQHSFIATSSSHPKICYNCKCKMLCRNWASNMPEFQRVLRMPHVAHSAESNSSENPTSNSFSSASSGHLHSLWCLAFFGQSPFIHFSGAWLVLGAVGEGLLAFFPPNMRLFLTGNHMSQFHGQSALSSTIFLLNALGVARHQVIISMYTCRHTTVPTTEQVLA